MGGDGVEGLAEGVFGGGEGGAGERGVGELVWWEGMGRKVEELGDGSSLTIGGREGELGVDSGGGNGMEWLSRGKYLPCCLVFFGGIGGVTFGDIKLGIAL